MLGTLWKELKQHVRETQRWERKTWALVWVPFLLIFVLAWAFDAWATAGYWVSVTPNQSTTVKLAPGASYPVVCAGAKPAGVEAVLRLVNHSRAFTIPATPKLLTAASTSFSQTYTVTMGLTESVLSYDQVQCQVVNKEQTTLHAVSQAPTFAQNPLPPAGWSVYTNTQILNYDAAHPTKKVTVTLTRREGTSSSASAAFIVSGNPKSVIVSGTSWMALGTGQTTTKTVYVPGSGLRNGDIVYVYIYDNGAAYPVAVSNRMGVRKY